MPFRIYTKTGDAGETALFGGRRVPKSHLRVDAYGTVDELNAFIGLLYDAVEDHAVRKFLHEVQHRLFSIGAYLATDPEQTSDISPDIFPADVQALEAGMDQMDATLPVLSNFILPGGHPPVSLSHVCRTVCRRAERLVVALQQQDPVEPVILQYLNRLSDYFFILARFLGHQAGIPEHIWTPRNQQKG
ncbi:MAG: cob(I)yrinic acid a,c-diamide adenosyltransferase [Bacteroidetes bacterium]|nr:MAG: cob(I)yrinic acid a,c-diamide adenosyltransferase [Bacteroidota bacterium]